MKLKIIGLLFLTVLALSLIVNTNSIGALSNSTNSTGNIPSNVSVNTNKLKTYLDQAYIASLGLSHSIVAVNSSIQPNFAHNKISLNYIANLSSKDVNYMVSYSKSNETIGNQVKISSSEKIIGKTNSSTSFTQTATTTSGLTTSEIIMNYIQTNTTGTYYSNLKSESNYTSDLQASLTGISQVDENITGLPGTYWVTANHNSNGDLQTIITSPDGRQVTSKGLLVSPELYVKPASKLSVSPCSWSFYPTMYNSQGINPAENYFSPANIGPIYAHGFFEYWAAGFTGVTGATLLGAIGLVGGGIGEAILGVLSGPVGVIGFLLGGLESVY